MDKLHAGLKWFSFGCLHARPLCFDDSIEQKSPVVDKLSGEFTRAHKA